MRETRVGIVTALLTAFTLASVSIASGQVNAPAAPAATTHAGVISRHGLGFSAGLLSGVGFAYRRHFANDFGIHIGGIAWGSKTDSFVSLGVEGIRTLSKSDKVRFYGLAGVALLRNNDEQFDYDNCYPYPASPADTPCVGERRVTGSISVGGGIGMEFTPGAHIGVSLEVPLSVMLELEKADRFSPKGIYPIPSVAIVYYF